MPDGETAGLFQLRTDAAKDSIGLTWATGRFPMTATVKLSDAQQRRYSQLALLTATSTGPATLKLRFEYETGSPDEAKIKVFDWSSNTPPANSHPIVDAPVPNSPTPRHMYLDLIPVDARRRLTAITLTWLTAGTEHPQHCVGIFAISGLPADQLH